MRILLMNSEYPPIGGGAGNASANLARRLARMGHEVTVLTSQYGNLPKREQLDNLNVVRIPSLRKRQDRSGALEQAAFIISASFSSLRLVTQTKPDITLAFFGIPSGVAALLLKIVRGIPYVVSLRGGDVPGFRPYDFAIYHKLIAPLLRLVWKNASAIVANSEGLRKLALDFDSRYAVHIIPNGVDVELYQTNAHENKTARLLSVGRVVYQKGLDLALHALADLKDLDWEWRVAGDGPQMNFLTSLARDLGIAERVQFLGWQSREQLIEQYRWANLFLFPSRHEGMPNAVLEAMASGLPVIASRIAGNEELVVDNETGILVPAEDVKSLQGALQKIIGNAPLREKMGQASRERVEKYFSWEQVARQYAQLLEKVK